MDHRQGVFERHIAILVLPQQRALIRLARRRAMRILTAPILLVQQTRLPETDRVVIEGFDREAQLADQRHMLGFYADVTVQDTVAAQAT